METKLRRQDFLAAKLASNDLVMVRVSNSPRPQVLRARVERIYSSAKGIDRSSLGAEIEFVHSPGSWGDVPLAVSERALLFVSLISGQLYEDAWRGHMLVEEIEGEMYAIYQHKELWLSEEVPAIIRSCARQDPRRPYATAIRLDVMEEYLLGLAEKMN